MGVEVRKVETTIGETGVGQEDRVDVSYELGAELDGAWVRFASVPQSAVDAAKARAQAEAAQAAPPADTSTEPPTPQEPSSGETTETL